MCLSPFLMKPFIYNTIPITGKHEKIMNDIQYFEFTDDIPCPRALFIGEKPYHNAAAKFWPRLIDEIKLSNPQCNVIELAAMSSIPLQKSVLFPELALEDDISRLWDLNLEDVMNETVAEMDIIGPPAEVTIRLLKEEDIILEQPMPPNSLDAETFPYFAAWLMEWANIDDSKWNDKSITSSITGEDQEREINYQINFAILYEHVSEGLHRRTVRLDVS